MDLAWLAGAGVLLLVTGLCALAYDTVRRKQESSPYPYPDASTTALDETAIQQKLALPPESFQPPTSAPQGLPPLPPLPRRTTATLRSSSMQVPAPVQSTAQSLGRGISRRAKGVIAVISLSAVGVALAVAVAQSSPAPAPPGSIVIGIAGFAGTPRNDDFANKLADDILKAGVESGTPKLVMRISQARPATAEQAAAELGRVKADFLLWGEVGSTGAITASLVIAPGLSVGEEQWQQFTSPELEGLLLPEASSLQLPPTAGTDPLVPLSLALAELKMGSYAASAKAAYGAQATIEGGGGQAQIGSLVEGVAQIGARDYAGALGSLAHVESLGSMPPEALVDRAVARLALSDYSGATADAGRALADREASDKTLALAHSLRAEAEIATGELNQALADLNESIRLDSGYLPARLHKAEALYRQAQPDAARIELDILIKQAPYAAPAYRQMGMVLLMLGQPENAHAPLAQADRIYSQWIGALRADEAKAQVTGDTSQAQRATDGILRLNREVAAVHLYEGMAWTDQGRKEPPETFLGGVWRNIRGQPTTYERALSEVQEAARLDPRRGEVPLQIGAIYTLMGDTTRAAQALQQAKELDPGAPEPYVALATMQQKQGNPQEAAKTLNALLARTPSYYAAYDQLYQIYTAAGDKGSATTTLQRAVQVAPQSAADHLWRGKFLRTLGSDDDAVAEFKAAEQDPSLWEAHLRLGEIFQQEGQNADALAEFQLALAIQPNDPTALLNAGKLLDSAGQPDDAEKTFQRLTAVAPGNVDGHIAYLQLLASKGNLDGAVAEGKRAVAADDKRADAHFFLGIALAAQQKWPEASNEFKAATERDPNYFEAFIRLAASLFHEDRYADAIAVSDKASSMRSDDPQPYRWKAEAQFALGDTGGALAQLGTALRLSPQYADALALTARVYTAEGDEPAAISYANKASQADPRNPAGLLALGELYLARGRSSEAVQTYSQTLQILPKSAEAITGQGRAYELAGDYNKALKLYNDAAQADPRYADAHLYAGETYVALGRWDDALKEYGTAVQRRPNWPVALYYLGRAYLERKDLGNAQAAFAKATQFAPGMVEAWFGLGIADRDMGQAKEAIDALNRAVQLKSEYADAWLYLGLTYEESGTLDKAAGAFTRARDAATDSSVKAQAEQGLSRVK
ncbi:MAG: tetratricopeptide repeat protein [Chloroflexi bacterium]|nr:tetratricopeptide repeat protein [Chloroflexota bacterium]